MTLALIEEFANRSRKSITAPGSHHDVARSFRFRNRGKIPSH